MHVLRDPVHFEILMCICFPFISLWQLKESCRKKILRGLWILVIMHVLFACMFICPASFLVFRNTCKLKLSWTLSYSASFCSLNTVRERWVCVQQKRTFHPFPFFFLSSICKQNAVLFTIQPSWFSAWQSAQIYRTYSWKKEHAEKHRPFC